MRDSIVEIMDMVRAGGGDDGKMEARGGIGSGTAVGAGTILSSALLLAPLRSFFLCWRSTQRRKTNRKAASKPDIKQAAMTALITGEVNERSRYLLN